MARILLVVLGLTLALGTDAREVDAAEVDILLVDGSTVHGTVLDQDDASIRVRRTVIHGAGSITDELIYPRNRISHIQTCEGDSVEYQQRAQAIADTAVEHASLARWCRERGLRDHAEFEALRAIALDDSLPSALFELEKLGFVDVEGVWQRRSTTSPTGGSPQSKSPLAESTATTLDRLHRQVASLRSQDDDLESQLRQLGVQRQNLHTQQADDQAIIARFHDLDEAYQHLLSQQTAQGYAIPRGKGVSVEAPSTDGDAQSRLALASDAVENIRGDARRATTEVDDITAQLNLFSHQERATSAQQGLVRQRLSKVLDAIENLSLKTAPVQAASQAVLTGRGYVELIDDPSVANRAAPAVQVEGFRLQQVHARDAPAPPESPMEMYQRLSAPGATYPGSTTALRMAFVAPAGWKIMLVDDIRGTLRFLSGESVDIVQTSPVQALWSENPLRPVAYHPIERMAPNGSPFAPGTPFSAHAIPTCELCFTYPKDLHLSSASLKGSMRVLLAKTTDLSEVRITPLPDTPQSIAGMHGSDLQVRLLPDHQVQWLWGGNALVWIHDVQYLGPHRQVLYPMSQDGSTSNDRSILTVQFPSPFPSAIIIHIYDHLQFTRNRFFIDQLPRFTSDQTPVRESPSLVAMALELPDQIPFPPMNVGTTSGPVGSISITNGGTWSFKSVSHHAPVLPPTAAAPTP